MAEEIVHDGKTLKELEREVTCGICQEHYTEPKALPCLHYYCKECVLRLAFRTGKNKPFSCPECRSEASLPEGGVDELKTAFFINRIEPMVTMLKRTHGKVEVTCEACMESGGKAEAFCRQCAMFICSECVKQHKRMKPLSTHDVASLEDLKEGRSKPIPVSEPLTRKCQVHEEPLIIYCFDCDTLICHLCTVKDHREHNFEFCKRAAITTKEKLLNDMAPLKEVQRRLSGAVEAVTAEKQAVITQGDTIANDIQRSFKHLHEILTKREKEMLAEVSSKVQEKVDKLSAQVKDLSLASAEVQSVVDYTERCIKHCADDEVMSMYSHIRKRIKQDNEQYRKPGKTFEPEEKANLFSEVCFDKDLQLLCQAKAKVHDCCINPAECVTIFKEGEIVEVGKVFGFQLNVNQPIQGDKVSCDAKSLSTGAVMMCDVDKVAANMCSIKFTPTTRGRYELTVSVNNEEVAGSPFSLLASISPSQLHTPVKILEVAQPSSVAINSEGHIIVAQYKGDLIKFNKEFQQEVLVTYSQTKLEYLRDISVDSDDNIYCIDETSNKILKCSKRGGDIVTKTLTNITGSLGGVAVAGEQVFVCGYREHTVGIYSRELEYIRCIKYEKMKNIMGISVDTHGHLYVADGGNSLIQVFSNDGTHLHSFGSNQKGIKMLSSPYGVCVSGHYVYVTNCNSNNVCVFTTDGAYMSSFGKGGSGHGDFNLPFNVCVDNDGLIYVADYRNNRIKIF